MRKTTLALAVTALCWTTPAAHAEAPLTADLSGTAAPDSTGALFSGSGTATHLGLVSVSGHAVITGGDSSHCQGGLANTNTETLTAANGDSVVLTSQDVACPDGSPGGYDGTGRWVLTSGTGRFAHATGSGALSGHSDLAAGTFTVHYTGSIDGIAS